MNTPISPERAAVIKQESIDYLRTTKSTSLKDAYIAGATAYAPYKERWEQAKKALEEYAAAHKPLPWQNVSDNANYKLYQRVNDLLATWKEEGKEGGV